MDFGDVMIASPNGRLARKPVSEGISPEKGADIHGPTAVIKSCAKMDHLKTGGTLLNQKFTPEVVAGEAGLNHMADLIRTYFDMDGHHIQFNVVGRDTLIAAQKNPEEYRDLIVQGTATTSATWISPCRMRSSSGRNRVLDDFRHET